MSDITDRVKKIVVEHLNVDEGKVSDDASFIDDLGDTKEKLIDMLYVIEEIQEPIIDEDSVHGI